MRQREWEALQKKLDEITKLLTSANDAIGEILHGGSDMVDSISEAYHQTAIAVYKLRLAASQIYKIERTRRTIPASTDTTAPGSFDE